MRIAGIVFDCIAMGLCFALVALAILWGLA